jgi:hypothetical protein
MVFSGLTGEEIRTTVRENPLNRARRRRRSRRVVCVPRTMTLIGMPAPSDEPGIWTFHLGRLRLRGGTSWTRHSRCGNPLGLTLRLVRPDNFYPNHLRFTSNGNLWAADCLFITQRHDRIERRRLLGGIPAEENSHQRRESEGQYYRHGADQRRPLGKKRD